MDSSYNGPVWGQVGPGGEIKLEGTLMWQSEKYRDLRESADLEDFSATINEADQATEGRFFLNRRGADGNDLHAVGIPPAEAGTGDAVMDLVWDCADVGAGLRE